MMGRFMQDEYAAEGYRDHGVRGQPLKVLYSTDMPSVLTEIGFMTNDEEFKYITSEAGQEKIVGALFRAIKKYIEVVNRSVLMEGGAAKSEQKAAKAPEVKEQKEVKEAAKKEAATEVKTPPTKSVKRYTIQVMIGKEKIPVTRFDFKSIKGQVWILETTGEWPYKYCYGDFADMASAQKRLEEVKKDFPQAFIRNYNKQE